MDLNTKIRLANFEKIIQGSSCSRELSRDLFSTGVNETLRFSRFLEHISKSFQYFFIKFSLQQDLIKFLRGTWKGLIISALVIMQKVPLSVKLPNLEISIWIFQDWFLTSILLILQIVVNLAYLKVAFPRVGFLGILFCDLPEKLLSDYLLILCLLICTYFW